MRGDEPPEDQLSQRKRARVPRMRGDEPYLRLYRSSARKSSPHARG